MLILFFSNFDITLLISPSISTYISLFSGNILELSPLIKSLGTPIVIASLVFKLILLLEIILLIIIISFTVLARIPTVSLSGSYGSTPLLLIKFVVGRYPIILAADAGILIEVQLEQMIMLRLQHFHQMIHMKNILCYRHF